MEELSWVVLALAILASLAFLSRLYSSKNYHMRPPPGPRPMPIIGNLNVIGPLPHKSLHSLSRKYGPLMQLRFGSFPVVVASSARMAREFLKTYDHIFASRPQNAAGKYTGHNYNSILWARYGPYYRQVRKLCLTELLSSKQLDSYEYIRDEERHHLVSRIYALSGKPVVLKEELYRLTLAVISRIVLGRTYLSMSESEPGCPIYKFEDYEEMLDEWLVLNGAFNIGDWIPWVNFLDLQGYVRRMKALGKRFNRFFEYVFDDHRARRRVEDLADKDMVDVLLQLADDPDVEAKLSSDAVKGITQDLLVGGSDTAATTIEWAMSELMKHPQLLKKATEELDRIIGQERWVQEEDLPKLPYINAVMKEVMRLHPAAVMLPPHLALEDCKVDGYDICKGTTIYISAWSIGRDPMLWDSPEEFRPERFLGNPIDVKGHHFELLPFGSGRRMCPGYNLGIKMVQSTLANLLHGFNWKLTGDMKPEDISMEEHYRLTTGRKYPLVAVMEPKLSEHLYN